MYVYIYIYIYVYMYRHICIWCVRPNVLFKADVSLLLFCLADSSIDVSGLLKVLTFFWRYHELE